MSSKGQRLRISFHSKNGQNQGSRVRRAVMAQITMRIWAKSLMCNNHPNLVIKTRKCNEYLNHQRNMNIMLHHHLINRSN